VTMRLAYGTAGHVRQCSFDEIRMSSRWPSTGTLRQAALGALVSFTVGGRRYPLGTPQVSCRAIQPGCGPRDSTKWLWIELGWPISSGDTVELSYSPNAKGDSRLEASRLENGWAR